MLTGEIRNQIDRIWDAFWSGGISNPLEVIEQITYLLFLRGSTTCTRWRRTSPPGSGKPMERRIFPEGKDSTRQAVRQTSAGRASSISRRREMFTRRSASTSFRSCARSAATTPPTRTT